MSNSPGVGYPSSPQTSKPGKIKDKWRDREQKTFCPDKVAKYTDKGVTIRGSATFPRRKFVPFNEGFFPFFRISSFT